MWNRNTTHDAFILSFTPHTIIYTYLHKQPEHRTIQLIQHHQDQCDALELEYLIIFNPTTIAQKIATQYRAYCTDATPILIALSGPSLFSKIVATHSAYPNREQLGIAHIMHTQWITNYLYSYEHRHYFYVCGLPHPLLLQYQLLAISTQLPLQTISSIDAALLSLYRHRAGSRFRHAELGTHLMRAHNQIDQLFTREDLHTIITIPNHIQIADDTMYRSLYSACGLFLAQGRE